MTPAAPPPMLPAMPGTALDAAAANAGERLIDHALGVEWAGLPASAQAAARTFLHDSIAVGVAGARAANADAVWAAARGWGGLPAGCPILGRPGTFATAPYAAFINAFQIHAQEYDAVHEPAVAHPMATVVAALLAEAARSGPYAGADVLAALVAGVDVVAALGVAVSTPLKFFRPATAGIFGCVAALARLRRLDRDTARDAMGHALAFAGGTMQAHVEGKPALALQVAAAARGAVEAIDLAMAGIAGSAGSIDGRFGYLPLFEDRFDLAPVLAALGTVWRIEEVSWKPFPTGRAAHGAIVALQALMRDAGITAANLDRFTYRAPPLIARLVGRRPHAAMDAPYARLCLPWLGAVVLTRGTVGLGDFSPEQLADPALHALAARITVEADDNPDAAAFVPATATATRHDGGDARITVTRQFGSPAWPLSRDEHLAKARACLAFGGMAGAHAGLAALLDGFDAVADVDLALAAVFAGTIGDNRSK